MTKQQVIEGLLKWFDEEIERLVRNKWVAEGSGNVREAMRVRDEKVAIERAKRKLNNLIEKREEANR